jgi:hypothetical protein
MFVLVWFPLWPPYSNVQVVHLCCSVSYSLPIPRYPACCRRLTKAIKSSWNTEVSTKVSNLFSRQRSFLLGPGNWEAVDCSSMSSVVHTLPSSERKYRIASMYVILTRRVLRTCCILVLRLVGLVGITRVTCLYMPISLHLPRRKEELTSNLVME